VKYIVMALNDAEEIFVFPRSVDHDRMVEACEAIRFGGERNWNRKYHDGEVVAAGFVDDGVCHGRSETLDLSSRGKKDTKLLAQFNRPAAGGAARQEGAAIAAQAEGASE
jgi:hypothetical protein